MNATTRRVLTVASLTAVIAVGVLAKHVPLAVFNLMLASLALPLVWLVWAFARWSAHQHANRYARDVEAVKGRRPAPTRQGASR